MPIINNETYVYLHDWKSFCKLFIKEGKHRFSSTKGDIGIIKSIIKAKSFSKKIKTFGRL